MAEHYTVRPYTYGDEEQIVELLELSFTGWPKFNLSRPPLEHWRWKYLDNLFNLTLIAVVELDGRIIGCWHRIPQKIKFGEIITFVGQGVDVAVHPDFQGRGMSSKLREVTLDISKKNDISMALGINTNPKLRKSENRRGAKDIATLFGMIKIDDVDLHFDMRKIEHSFMKKYGYNLLKIKNKIGKLKVFNSYEQVQEFHIDTIDKFDAGIDDFWREIEREYDFIVLKNKEYLNWRYCDPCGGKYVIKQAVYNDHILGYSVLRINERVKEYPLGSIVDLLALPQRFDVAEALIKDALLFFDNMNVNSVNCWQFQNNYYKIYMNHGFINTGSLFFQYTLFDDNLSLPNSSLFSPENIHFALGDSDWI
ncbi:hypothetical protein MCGE09_00449 [Thaumarchaeota archaeon SCGC AB-539-E09]|nr:hypothetical protein MCGE09_00449 [Thaumarchaeota archaeon SCGC AB-539-E09]